MPPRATVSETSRLAITPPNVFVTFVSSMIASVIRRPRDEAQGRRRALLLLLGRHPNSESFRIFFHQPADYALLEVDNDDDDQQTQGHELPAKEIGPGYFLNDVEHDGTDYGAPESALAAEQHH